MANPDHLEILSRGIKEWYQWREAHPDIKPDFFRANLTDTNLRMADLNKSDLREADLNRANLGRANLSEADLRRAKLNNESWGRAAF